MVYRVRLFPVVVLAVTAWGLPAMAATTAPADDVSLDRARTLYKDGNYKDAVATLAQLQEAQGAAADSVDRYALFMLKAEAQMRLGDAGMAIASLGAAHKEAAAAEQKAPAAAQKARATEQKAQATALEILLRRSPTFEFKPKTGAEGRSFDILSEQGRKDAMTALLADEMDGASKRFAAAKAGSDLGALAEFSRTLLSLQAIEIAATGKGAACEEMAKALRERLFVVVDADLTATETQVKTINANADKIIDVTVSVQDPNTRRIVVRREQHHQGPTTKETGTLKSLAAEHERMRTLVTELATNLSVTPESLKTRQARNDAVLKDINTILTTDYSKPVAMGQGNQPRRGGGAGGGGGANGG